MADPSAHPDPANEPKVPAALAEALGGLYPPGGQAVPPALDEAILREARAGFARRRRFWLYARAAGAAAAAAAAAVVVVVIYLDRDRASPTPVAGTQAVRTGDVDQSGRVDVLDALVLARRVQAGAGGTPRRGDDVNGDGVVDRRDVDAVAVMAVSVSPPGDGGPR